MPASRPWSTVLLPLVAGAALGCGARIFLKAPTPATTHAAAGTRATSPAPAPPGAGKSGAAAESGVRPSLAAILAEKDLTRQAMLLARFLASATSDECGQAATQIEASTAEHSDQLPWLLLSRWAEVDPAAALAFTSTHEGWDTAPLFETWATADFPAAWAAALGLPEKTRPDALLAVIQGLATTDPRRAWAEATAHAAELPPDFDKVALLSALAAVDPQAALAQAGAQFSRDGEARDRFLSALANTHPEAALDWARALTDGEARDSAIGAVMRRVCGRDVEMAKKLLTQLPRDTGARWSGVLAKKYARQDTAAAREWATALPPGTARNEALAGVAVTLAHSENPEDAIPLFASMGWNVSESLFAGYRRIATTANEDQNSPDGIDKVTDALTRTLKAWGKIDPAAALKQTFSMAGAWDNASDAGEAIVTEWGRRDPAAALAAIAALPENKDETRDTLLSSFFGDWAGRDFAAAEKSLAILPKGDALDNAVSAMASTLAEKSPEEALAWVRAHSDSPGSPAIQIVWENLARRDPRAALARLESFGLAPAQRKDYISTAAHILMEKSPTAALDLLVKEGVTGSNLTSGLDTFLRSSPRSASEWVATLPPGPAREDSVVRLTNFLRSSQQPDFEAAFLWGQTLQDSSRRDPLLVKTLRSWEQRSPGAARLALDQSSLPQADREVLHKAVTTPMKNIKLEDQLKLYRTQGN